MHNAMRLLNNAVEFVRHFDVQRPITFLGVRARLAVLITAGTLVVSASSVGLRSAALAVVHAIETELNNK